MRKVIFWVRLETGLLGLAQSPAQPRKVDKLPFHLALSIYTVLLRGTLYPAYIFLRFFFCVNRRAYRLPTFLVSITVLRVQRKPSQSFELSMTCVMFICGLYTYPPIVDCQIDNLQPCLEHRKSVKFPRFK